MMLKGRTSRSMFLFTTFLVIDISLFSQLTFLRPETGVVRGRTIPPAPVTLPVANPLQTTTVQRIYVQHILNLPVVQQPKENANFVSPRNGELTQFATVSQYGNVGLLAHNYLAGSAFSDLRVGQEAVIQYSNGETESFIITELLRYQALDPKNPYSSFQNINDESDLLSVGEMFDRVYKGDRHLTLQTCIARYGNSSWGRLFVIATPKPDSMPLKSRGWHVDGSYNP